MSDDEFNVHDRQLIFGVVNSDSEELEKGREYGDPRRSLSVMCKDFSDNFTIEQLRILAKLSGIETVNEKHIDDVSKDELCSALLSDYEETRESRKPPVSYLISKLYMLGDGRAGELGLGNYNSRDMPVHLAFKNNIVDVSCGDGFTAFITDTGQLYTFGNNSNGEMGFPRETIKSTLHQEYKGGSVSTPTLVPFSDKVIKVSCGVSHVACITDKGELYVWGLVNVWENVPEEYPYKVQISNGDSIRFTDVSCGSRHTACITDQGALYTFGSNRHSQLGVDTNSSYSQTPVRVDIKGKAIKVECGGYHTAVIMENNDCYFFGSNNAGQLGIGSKNYKNAPVRGPIKFIDISCGYAHTAAIGENGELYLFGRYNTDRAGTPDEKDDKLVPTLIDLEAAKVIKVSAGFYRTGIITRSKKAFTFGGSEELGHLKEILYPAVTISCGGRHTAVLVGDLNEISKIPREEQLILRDKYLERHKLR